MYMLLALLTAFTICKPCPVAGTVIGRGAFIWVGMYWERGEVARGCIERGGEVARGSIGKGGFS